MGKYQIRNKKTGETKIIESNVAPTSEEAVRYFSSSQQPQTPNTTTDIGMSQQPSMPDISGFQRFLQGVQKNAPTVGAVGVPAAGAIGTGGLSIPASALLSGAGYIGGSGVANMSRDLEDIIYNNKQMRGDPAADFAKAGVGGATTAAFDALLGKMLSPLLNKIYGPVGPLKGVTPGGLKSSADTVASKAWEKVAPILESVSGRKIDPTDAIKIIEDLAKKSRTANRPLAEKGVEKAATQAGLNKPINVKQAQGVKEAFSADIFGESGKQLKTRGFEGKMTKNAKQLIADNFAQQIKDVIGSVDPAALKSYNQYGAASNIGRDLAESPLRSNTQVLGGLAGATTGILSGNPLLGAGVGAAIGLGPSPYFRTLIPQILGRSVSSIRPGLEIPGSYYLNQILNNRQ